MSKIVFDTSIHLGQFRTDQDDVRVACKNSQTAISTKGDDEIIGVVTFNENTWADHIIWGLEREAQDIFYKFMDVFHSVKNIDRIPLALNDTEMASDLVQRFSIDVSNALTCSVAISQGADAVHTQYRDLLNDDVVAYMDKEYGINVMTAPIGDETSFKEGELERFYQDALASFGQRGINLADRFHG